MHIPLPEYLHMYNNVSTVGEMAGIGCPIVNSGLFDQFVKYDNIKAVFCGHDHATDIGGFL